MNCSQPRTGIQTPLTTKNENGRMKIWGRRDLANGTYSQFDKKGHDAHANKRWKEKKFQRFIFNCVREEIRTVKPETIYERRWAPSSLRKMTKQTKGSGQKHTYKSIGRMRLQSTVGFFIGKRTESGREEGNN